ncbi:hypothetical protein NYE54_17290 [Paenibacillus sp. FSL K6-1330]|uniref:hypothetical protein n=1 Tax=Paenibacillus sp. FSL K6-1330 TaxID=2975292 RepID=UPI0030DCDF4A
MQEEIDGVFRFRSTCNSCRREFYVIEGTQAYDRVKRNSKGMHYCEDCKNRIELEARLQLGRRLLTGRD